MVESKALNHLIAQTRQNISLLQELEQVSRVDSEIILAKLPLPQTTTDSFRARATFNYNEDGTELKDISFTAGDVIEVLEETNVNWWRGRHRGREGLFPSSYVERLTYDGASRPVPPPTTRSYQHMAPPPFSPYPPGLPPQPYYGPPPQHPAPYPLYSGPPPPPPAPVIVHNNPPETKKPFGGSLGNTLAHSAVGGAGFGAGSALASDLVNRLF